jgi:CheY-like chemotaxis protein
VPFRDVSVVTTDTGRFLPSSPGQVHDLGLTAGKRASAASTALVRHNAYMLGETADTFRPVTARGLHTLAEPTFQETAMSEAQTAGLNVLVVEDDEDAATIEALLLATENHVVRIVSDGPAALREVQQVRPDVVLLDLSLPGLDGYEVARRIRDMELPTRPLLVAVTGRCDEADVCRSKDVGIDMHFVKPVSPEILLMVLRGSHA